MSWKILEKRIEIHYKKNTNWNWCVPQVNFWKVKKRRKKNTGEKCVYIRVLKKGGQIAKVGVEGSNFPILITGTSPF